MVKVLDRVGRIAVTQPDWRKAVTVGYEFKTAIITSYDGSEMRDALRSTARVQLGFRTILTAAGIRRHHADLAEVQHVPFVLPSPWRRTYLAVDVLPSTGAISITTPPFWCAPNSHLVLDDGSKQEAVEIDTVVGSAVTLKNPTVGAFAAGSTVRHAYLARGEGKIDFRAETATLWTANLDYDVAPGSDAQTYRAAVPTMFEGAEVFLTRPNWRERPRISLSEVRELLDSGRGVVDTESHTARMMQQERLEYLGSDIDASEALIAFFLRHKGSRTAFWMPTWQQDLEVANTPVSASEFDVPGIDAFYGYNGSDVFNVVAARWPDGSYQLNRVTGVALNGSDTTFTFRDDWVNGVTPDTRVSWCPLWRFSTDKLEVNWRTNTLAEMSFAVQTLKNEEPV